ncbi:oligosaccharide flippase family protein [Streptomyces sioyaensis]|uniref:oligosaccharide flippase family protein n=1 Tax=Streptomyces sioyaensis TaxID=67364 RepID=UPI0033D29C89
MSAVRSLAWNYAGSAIQLVLQLGCTAITARLVAPEAFGAYATAQTVAALLGFFAGSCVATCLMRAEQLTRALLRSATSLAALAGVGMTVAAQLIAPLVAGAWHMAAAKSMLQILSLQFLTQPASLAATTALRRLAYPVAAVRAELLGQVGGSAAMLFLLVSGWNPYAIAAAMPLTTALTLGLAFVPLARIQLPKGNRIRISELLGDTGFFTGYGLVQSLTNYAPLWLTGALLGPAAAGQFSRASLLSGVPLHVLSQGLYRAATPPLAAARAHRMASAAHDVLCAASATALIALGAFAGIGPALLLLVLGPGWETATRLVPLLAGGAALSLMLTMGIALDQVRRAPGACVRTQIWVIATTASFLVAAWSEHSLMLCAAAGTAGPAAGLLAQHVQWYRKQVLPLRPLLIAHSVHMMVATALFLAGRLGMHGIPARRVATGCAAMAPVLLFCVLLRRRLPIYSVARRYTPQLGASRPQDAQQPP